MENTEKPSVYISFGRDNTNPEPLNEQEILDEVISIRQDSSGTIIAITAN